MVEVNYKEGLLSDELLNNVTGGTTSETADDTRFLNSLIAKRRRIRQCKWRYSGSAGCGRAYDFNRARHIRSGQDQ